MDLDQLRMQWRLHPESAVIDWLKARPGAPLRAHSLTQYATMLAAAPDWWRDGLAEPADRETRRRGPARPRWSGAASTLLDADDAALHAFLNSRGRGTAAASAGTLRRYLVLFDSLFDHLVELGLRTDNPAKEMLARTPELHSPDRSAPTFLPRGRADAYLLAVRAQPATTWRQQRDRALRLIFLATGITLEEARTLRANDVYLGDPSSEDSREDAPRLNLGQHGRVKARAVPMPAWFLNDMRQWMQARSTTMLATLSAGDASVATALREQLATGPVFISSQLEKGAPAALSDIEMYEIVRPMLREAGHDGDRLGPQTLRNTFAVRQLDNGVKDETIRRWMGLQTNFTIDALRRQLPLADGERIY